MSPHLDATQFPEAFAYEHTDIAPGMTLGAWRAERDARHPARHQRWPHRRPKSREAR
jgi:hypothetical protein